MRKRITLALLALIMLAGCGDEATIVAPEGPQYRTVEITVDAADFIRNRFYDRWQQVSVSGYRGAE